MFEKALDVQRQSAMLANDSGNYTTATQPVGHIAQHGSELEQLVMSLADEINALENRLSPFLRPDQPQPTGSGGSTPTPVMAPFAQALGEVNMRIRIQTQRVRSFTARLDI